MTTPHKYKDILIAIADGKRVQCRIIGADSWVTLDEELILSLIAHYGNDYEFRITPSVMTIGGREVERPMGPVKGSHEVGITMPMNYEGFFFSSEKSAKTFYSALTHIATHGDQPIDKAALIERAVERYKSCECPNAVREMFEYCLGGAT